MNQENYGEGGVFYLVRLREGFRLQTMQPRDVTVHFNQIKKLFRMHETARVYARNTLPTDTNPFDMDTDWGLAVQRGFITIVHWDVDDDGFDNADGEELQPSSFVPDGHIMISDSETRIEDFAQLCQRIGIVPPDLGNAPFLSWQDFVTDELRKVWQNTNVGALRQWWEDQKDAMTSEQKAAIWRKLHPRPYEIVPVQWER